MLLVLEGIFRAVIMSEINRNTESALSIKINILTFFFNFCCSLLKSQDWVIFWCSQGRTAVIAPASTPNRILSEEKKETRGWVHMLYNSLK